VTDDPQAALDNRYLVTSAGVRVIGHITDLPRVLGLGL
jgi:hypothetical protein